MGTVLAACVRPKSGPQHCKEQGGVVCSPVLDRGEGKRETGSMGEGGRDCRRWELV